MNENKQIHSFNQIMDLREIVQIILNHKWFIILVTGLSVTIALLSSIFLLSPQYKSSAFVTLTEPIIDAEFDSNIRISPIMPDTQALAELVETEEIYKLVLTRLELTDYFGDEKLDMQASLRGKSQLLLEVINQDPIIAAKLANGWAEIVVERLNSIYGTTEFTLQNLEVEVDLANQEWIKAQQDLESYLPESRVDVIDVELSQEISTFSSFLFRIENNNKIIEDSLSLMSMFLDLDPERELALGEALSLIALQQRSSGGVSGAEFQIQGNDFLGEQYSIQEAIDSLNSLIKARQLQNSTLESDILSIKEEITRLSVELESEAHKVERLTQERDLARSTFIALSNQLVESRITESQNGSTAKIGSAAIEPKNPSGPSVLVNSALAGIAGISLSILAILIYEWWNTNNKKTLAE